jgi:hypothetical protein
MHDERGSGDGPPDAANPAAPADGDDPADLTYREPADMPPPAAEAWPSEPPRDRDETSDWRTSQPDHEAPPDAIEAYPAHGPVGDARDTGDAGSHTVPPSASETGDSTKCPRCGTENRPGLAFCRSCGGRLAPAGAAPIQRPGTPEGSTACPRCGTHNRAGVAFCQNCGANLRGVGAAYVAPNAAADRAAAARRAVLGPVVLLIGLAGLATGYILPFAYGSTSLAERAWGSGGYGAAFWAGYPEVGASLADQAYFGLAAPIPILGIVIVGLAIAGFVRARPRAVQLAGLALAIGWALALVVLFVLVEVAANWAGDLVGLLRELSPGGIILFLASLIVLIGALTRLGRS